MKNISGSWDIGDVLPASEKGFTSLTIEYESSAPKGVVYAQFGYWALNAYWAKSWEKVAAIGSNDASFDEVFNCLALF